MLKTPKTESSVRNVYLPATVITALRDAQKAQAQNKLDLGAEYLDFNIVVAQPNGWPYEEHLINAKLRKLIRENDLKPVVFHSLRHSSTSLKLKLSGGDIKAVQGDTGHAQSNMVTDVYSHIMDEDRRSLAKKMERIFFNPQSVAAPADDSAKALFDLVNSTSELAASLLQMVQLLTKNVG